jgi:hypothetical protein
LQQRDHKVIHPCGRAQRELGKTPYQDGLGNTHDDEQGKRQENGAQPHLQAVTEKGRL